MLCCVHYCKSQRLPNPGRWLRCRGVWHTAHPHSVGLRLPEAEFPVPSIAQGFSSDLSGPHHRRRAAGLS